MSGTKLIPTEEQRAILDAAATGEATAISAAGGTGKTSTLRMIAGARPHARMLYVAFNKAIQVEADGTFPSNVTCKTAHALAYRAFGAEMRERLNGPRMTGAQNAKVLGIGATFGFDAERTYSPAAQASMAMGMVAHFCRSAAPNIEPRMLHALEGLSDVETAALARHLLPYAQAAWADLTAGAKGRLKPTHDVYRKRWQLSRPELTGWDVILYDECQDADPAIADVVERQHHAQLVAVGDSAQAIYAWRGAGDFLGRVDAKHRLQLTQSWRFGQAIADEANVWLGVAGTDTRVRGNPGRHSRLHQLDSPDAVLCRSNAGTIEQLLAAHSGGTKVHLVGDGREMLALGRAAERLQKGQPVGHPELIAFTTWAQLVEYAQKDPAGSDLAVAVKMIELYGSDGVIRAIEGAGPADRAELIVSTAHKSKGLEWGKVRIGTDFVEPLDKKTGKPLPIPKTDAMLAYVSVTRAMDVLENAGLAWVHDHLDTLGETVDREGTPPLPAVTAAPVAAEAQPADATATPSTSPSILDEPTLPEPNRTQALIATASAPSRSAPDPASRPSTADDVLAAAGLAMGAKVLVAGERGTFTVRGVGGDGSLTCHSVEKAGGARSFPVAWVIPATRAGRGGKPVQVRTVPAEARQARANWERAYGIHVRQDDPPAQTGAGIAV